MKKLIKIFLIIIILVYFSACGKNDNEHSNSANFESSNYDETSVELATTTIDGFSILPNEVKIVDDINEFSDATFTINTGSYKLETKSVKIEKASKDEKKYTIYCYATQESDKYKAENYYLLVYNYYDIGGWVLDECTIKEKNIVPITACEMEFAYKNLQQEFNLTKCDFIKVEKVNDTEYTYYFTGKKEYNYMINNYELLVYCFFDQEKGWSFDNDYTYNSEDWSRMYGTWYGKGVYGSEYTGYECKIEVISVDDKANTVKMIISIFSPWKNSIPNEVIAKKEYVDSTTLFYEWGHYFLRGKVLYERYDSAMDIYYDEYNGIKTVRYNGDMFYMDKIK